MVPPDLPTVSLMQPTLVSTPFHREGWVYEEKYDGWRMVAYKREDRVQLISRPVGIIPADSLSLEAAIASPATLILDGEVCLFYR
jgi:bifunctional non-homologous end joining protein LigD